MLNDDAESARDNMDTGKGGECYARISEWGGPTKARCLRPLFYAFFSFFLGWTVWRAAAEEAVRVCFFAVFFPRVSNRGR
jgi:hypothetical protein